MGSQFAQDLDKVLNSPAYQDVSNLIKQAHLAVQAGTHFFEVLDDLYEKIKKSNLNSFKDMFDVFGSENAFLLLDTVFSIIYSFGDVQTFKIIASSAEVAANIRKLQNLIDEAKKQHKYNRFDEYMTSLEIIIELANIINSYIKDKNLQIVIDTTSTLKDIVDQVHNLVEDLKCPGILNKILPGTTIASDLLDILTTFIKNDELVLAKDVTHTAKDILKVIDDIKRIRGGPVIPEGSLIKCTCGTFPTPIQVTPISCPIKVGGKPVARISDCQPKTNIIPFGKCYQLRGADCQFEPVDVWLGLPQVNFSADASLTIFSTLKCIYGGEIQPTVFQKIVSAGKWLDAIMDGIEDAQSVVSDVRDVALDIDKLEHKGEEDEEEE